MVRCSNSAIAIAELEKCHNWFLFVPNYSDFRDNYHAIYCPLKILGAFWWKNGDHGFCNLKILFSLSISAFSSASVGRNSLYLEAKSCSFPFSMEYLAMSESVSEQSTMPMVGLSSSFRFSSSNMRTYMSICPTSWWVIWAIFKSMITKHFRM